MNQDKDLRGLASELGLRSMAENMDEILRAAADGTQSFQDIIFQYFNAEYQRRLDERRKQRIRTAGFPRIKLLEQLNRDELPQGVKTLLPTLEAMDFIAKAQNIVLYGNPGTGKTHIATGLGIKACAEGYSVMFCSVPHLITQIKECKSSRTLHALENRFKKYDLVICDEFGYVSCDKEAGELLFNHLSLRADAKSTIITTNLAFDRWGEVIKDKVLVAALVDRLTHNAHLINMNGESYRLKETKKLNKK